MQLRRVVLRVRHAFGAPALVCARLFLASHVAHMRHRSGVLAVLAGSTAFFYQARVWRTETKLHVTKGDHDGLATASVVLVCYTVVTSRRSVWERSVQLRRATLSAKGSTKGGSAGCR